MEMFDYFISVEESEDITLSKYASKTKNFYDDLLKYQQQKPISNFKIKPIQFTFEITNKCNCNCPNCGMSANMIEGKNVMSKEELFFIIEQLHNIGVPSIAYTGGEPFLEFNLMCEGIKYSQNKIDTIKIISNGFWGNNPKYYFDKLINAGLFNNKLFVPSIYISIGEQNVKLDYIANLINYVTENKLNKQINFGIINTRHKDEKYSKLEQLFELYVDKFGKFPYQKIYLTDSIYVNSNKLAKEKMDLEQSSIYEIIDYCDNTFNTCIGKFVSPKIFMKCNGDCYPCEVFNYHKDVYLGNLFQDKLLYIIEQFNNNNYIKFINEYGTTGFKKVIPKQILLENHCETVCQACEFCIKFCEKNKLIKY